MALPVHPDCANAKNPEEARPKSCPLGVSLKCAFAHSNPGEASFPAPPGCPNCEPRPKPRNTVRTRRPPAEAVNSGPFGAKAPSGLDIHLAADLRWSVKGWAPPRDRCHPPKRKAMMRVSPHHSARFPGGHLPKDQTRRTRWACALRAIAKVSTTVATRNRKSCLLFAHCDEFSRTNSTAQLSPIVQHADEVR